MSHGILFTLCPQGRGTFSTYPDTEIALHCFHRFLCEMFGQSKLWQGIGNVQAGKKFSLDGGTYIDALLA